MNPYRVFACVVVVQMLWWSWLLGSYLWQTRRQDN